MSATAILIAHLQQAVTVTIVAIITTTTAMLLAMRWFISLTASELLYYYRVAYEEGNFCYT